MIRCAYLRVYVPADRAGTWMSHVSGVRHRAIMRASDHFVWTETTSDDAFTIEWEGSRYVCPRYPRLRMLEGAVAFNATYPGSMLLPDVTVQRLARELDAIRAEAPDARSYILPSPWHVPLRWFVPFLAEQKEIYEVGGVTSARYRTAVGAGLPRVARAAAILDAAGFDDAVIEQVRDLERWLSEFSSGSMLELDYAGVADLFQPADIALDESAEEVAASLAALEAYDYERAGEHYAAVAMRWAPAQALGYVN
jgi:hypothetical protein